MDEWSVRFALHGALVLAISIAAGLPLHASIRLNRPVGPWHLAHAGGSARALLLFALAGIHRWVALPRAQRDVYGWLMLLFVWTSVAAMIVAAVTGRRGLGWKGSPTDRVVFGLYVVGVAAVVPSVTLLIMGLLRAR